jgi:hypothetical protein
VGILTSRSRDRLRDITVTHFRSQTLFLYDEPVPAPILIIISEKR